MPFRPLSTRASNGIFDVFPDGRRFLVNAVEGDLTKGQAATLVLNWGSRPR